MYMGLTLYCALPALDMVKPLGVLTQEQALLLLRYVKTIDNAQSGFRPIMEENRRVRPQKDSLRVEDLHGRLEPLRPPKPRTTLENEFVHVLLKVLRQVFLGWQGGAGLAPDGPG